MRRREVKWLEMLTQWDAYMLRNYRKVIIFFTNIVVFIIIMFNIIIMVSQHHGYHGHHHNMINSMTAGAGALSKRDPSEYKGEGLASSLWSKISGWIILMVEESEDVEKCSMFCHLWCSSQ